MIDELLEKAGNIKDNKKWLWYIIAIPVGFLVLVKMYQTFVVSSANKQIEEAKQKDEAARLRIENLKLAEENVKGKIAIRQHMIDKIKNKPAKDVVTPDWHLHQKKEEPKEQPKQKRKLTLEVYCVETGEVFKSIIEASKKMNIPYNTMKNHIKTGKILKRLKGYTFKRVE